MDDSFRVCGCTDTVVDRIGFAIREGRRYEDGGMAWYVCLQGQEETGLYNGATSNTPSSYIPLFPSPDLSEVWVYVNCHHADKTLFCLVDH